MTFYYLLLGHLLGDFTFQTDKIAEKKNNDDLWIIFHTIIVTLSTIIFSIPFGIDLVLMAGINGLLHFIIDYFKSKLYIKNASFAFFYFLVDQTVHIFIIFIISQLVTPINTILPFSKNEVTFLISFVFISSFSTIFVQYILNIYFSSNNKSFFVGNERSIGNITRILSFFILYFAYIYSAFITLFILSIGLAEYILYAKKWHLWMSIKYFMTKFILDVLMSSLGFLFIIYIQSK